MTHTSRMALVVLAELTGCGGCVSTGTKVDAEGGVSTDSQTVTFTFDNRGVLKTTATSTSQQQINTGLANQN